MEIQLLGTTDIAYSSKITNLSSKIENQEQDPLVC